MAANDIFIYTNATSVANAVITSNTVTTAASFPDLVLGDSPTYNFRFTDGAAAVSWAGNAQYSIEWALGTSGADDSVVLAYQTQATAITGGWTMVLPLNTGAILSQLNSARISQEYPVVRLWQQIRVTDPSGYKTTYATIRTNLRLRTVPNAQPVPDDPLPAGYRVVKTSATGELADPSNFLSVNSITVPVGKEFRAQGNAYLANTFRNTTYGGNFGFVNYSSNNSSGGGSLSNNDVYAFGFNIATGGALSDAAKHQMYQGFEADYVNAGNRTMEWYIRFLTPTSPGPSSTHEAFFAGFNKDTGLIFETDVRGELVVIANSSGLSPFARFSTASGIEFLAATLISGSGLLVNASAAEDGAIEINKTFGGADGSVQRLLKITGTDLAVAANEAHYLVGGQITSGEGNIASGITDSGYRIGLNIVSHLNSPSFLGTLATQIGIRTSFGILDSGASGARTITTATGINAECQLNDTGTIVTGYLARLSYAGGTTTVTNKWGLYVTGEAKNYLSGNLIVGTVPEHADNAAAAGAGLANGTFYRTGDTLKVVHP